MGVFKKTLMVIWAPINIIICHATAIWDFLHQQLESQYSLGVYYSAKNSATQCFIFQH